MQSIAEYSNELSQSENMSAKIVDFCNSESGATAVEYGLFAALMSIAGMSAFAAIGTTLETFFESVGNEIGNAGN